MELELRQTIYKTLGSNNMIIIVPDGYCPGDQNQKKYYLTECARLLTEQLNCFSIINNKYKKTIIDLSDVRAIKQRKKITDSFLLPIKQFKDEIAGNDLQPLILILQTIPPDMNTDKQILFGYGQGERGHTDRPHRPTLSPSLLSRIRLLLDDQELHTDLAPTNSTLCGREPHSLNQLFRQKNYVEDFYDQEVRSILVNIDHNLILSNQQALATATALSRAFKSILRDMSLVRKVEVKNIDTVNQEDLKYIFRINNKDNYKELLRESYIDELAVSIDRNGLLHPLVLLQKDDGRYKILCGFRRFQALKKLNRQWVEAKVYHEGDFTTEDFFNISLAENTKRRNLNPIEIGNFLESAHKEMGLNNTMLAEQFGETLGIGTPGKKVSQSTVHKYRKVNKIRLRGESKEIISDVINDNLQFTIAAEILAPIQSPTDRDAIYLEVIKPLSPTRPQLQQIIKTLQTIHPGIQDAIETEAVQQALVRACDSKQKATTFIRLLQKTMDSSLTMKKEHFEDKITALRKKHFGTKANKRDFNITTSNKKNKAELTLHVRLKEGNNEEVLQKLRAILQQQDLLSSLTDIEK